MVEFLERRLPDVRKTLIRNGFQHERQVQTVIGTILSLLP